MEKPGMGRSPIRRAGLLILMGALIAPMVLAQSAPTILGETSPASPLAGSLWTVTLLVDHPTPEEVEATLPPLPAGLSLDRLRIEPRLLPTPGGGSSVEGSEGIETGRRWTALQYRFLTRTPGRIALGPIEVRVKGVAVMGPALSVTVRPLPAPPRPEPPRLFWRDLPTTLTVGKEARLSLCVSGQNLPEIPAEGLSVPPVPPMSIVEAVPREVEDEVLAIRVIPLEGPFFTLPAFTAHLGTLNLAVPAIRIPVAEAEKAPVRPEAAAASGAGQAEPPETAAASTAIVTLTGGVPPFPAGSRGLQGAAGRVREKARLLWEGGQPVEALAELRRNERDHPAGFALAGLRREAESALGLDRTIDEVWRPPLLLIPGLLIFLILAALCLTLPHISSHPQAKGPRGWVSRAACLVFTLAALFCLFRLSPLSPYGDVPRQALARDAVVYRVPEDTGTGISRFRPGRGILVYEIRDGWAYAESLQDEVAGWIKAGTYLSY